MNPDLYLFFNQVFCFTFKLLLQTKTLIMKKRSLKNLALNKKSISSFKNEVVGGAADSHWPETAKFCHTLRKNCEKQKA